MAATATDRFQTQYKAYLHLRADLWRHDPERYCRERLNLKPTWQQRQILEAITPDGSRVSVRSGHNIGKDAIAAGIILWFMETRDFARVPCTAPTGHQLYDVLWGEIAKWMRKSEQLSQQRGDHPRFWLTNLFRHTQDMLYDLSAPKEWYAVARTARKEAPEGLQGFHASDIEIDDTGEAATVHGKGNLLVVVDEACFDKETEILTDKGWRYFHALEGDEQMLTMDPDTGIATYKTPIAYYISPYEGYLYTFQHRAINFAITPNHRLWYRYKRRGGYGSKMCAVKDITSAEMYIPRKVTRKALDTAFFTMPGTKDRYGRALPALQIDMDVWVAFLGWYFSEGSLGYMRGKVCRINISQQGIKGREMLQQLLQRLPFPVHFYKNDIHINSTRLAQLVASYGFGFKGKRFPSYFRDLSSRQIRLFLDAYLQGDGYERENGRRIYYTSSQQIADDLQELIILSGAYASVTRRKIAGQKKWIHTHFATSSCDGFVVAESKEIHFAKVKRNRMTQTYYRGNVYCVTVPPHHLIYVRRHGTCHWSGNSGVPDEAYEVLEGALASPGARALLIGNPTRNTGVFAASHKHQRGEYVTLHYKTSESPLADPSYRQRLVRKFGEDSNVVRVRADGEFPKADDDTLIALEYCEAALRARETIHVPGRKRLGVDVARFGNDRTTYVTRDGNIVPFIAIDSKQDTMTTTGKALRHAERLQVDDICVDVIGLGAGVYDRLVEIMDERRLQGLWTCEVIAVNAAETAPRRESDADAQGKTMRDYLWLEMRAWLRDALPAFAADPDYCEDLAGELSAPKFKLDSSGRIVVESKDEMKRRNIRSPDLADALGCTFTPQEGLGSWGFV